jgi:hypothetical protein
MGINVSLVRLGAKYTDRLPYIDKPGYRYTDANAEFGWDALRHSGDREIPRLCDGESYFVDETQHVSRPANSDQMLNALLAIEPANEQRWRSLAKALSENPNVFVYASW